MSATRAVLSAIRKMTAEGPVRVSVAKIAEAAGVHRVTCVKVINDLVQRGQIFREGAERSVCTYSTPKASDPRPLPPPRPDDGTKDWESEEHEEDFSGGREYTELLDRDVALRDRCILFAKRGHGPAWMVERGKRILAGEELPPL